MAVANSANISTIQILRSYANSAPSTLADGQLAFSFLSNTLYIGSNTGGVIAISDQATANLARQLANTIIGIQGVDTSQNARITIIEGVDASQNVLISILQNVNLTQNTAIAATDGKMQSAYNQANVTIGVDATQNTNIAIANTRAYNSVLRSGDTMTGVLYFQADTANTAVGAVEQYNGIDLFANTGALHAQLNYANTNFVWVDSQVAAMTTEGVSLTLQQSTLNAVLSAGGQIYTFHPDGNLEVPVEITVPTANINGYNIFDYSNASFTRANSSANLAQAAYNQANVTAGGLITANANSVYIKAGLDSANANISILFATNTTQNTRLTVIENTDLSQNVRLDYSNTAITIIQGVDLGQNTAIAATDGKMQSAYNQANTGTVLAQAAYNQANVTIGVDATQNTRLTVIEGTNLSQNSRIDYSNAAITIIQGVDVSQNARMAIIEGVDATQNTRLSVIENTDLSQNVRLDYSNTAIQILTGNTSPNLYLTSVGSSVNSIAVGGAPVQNAQVWGTYTIVQVLDTLLFPTIGPTYTIPTITLSANNSGTFEIGQSINQSLSVTGNKNDAGPFTQIRINRNTINLTTNNSPTITPITNIAAQFGYVDPNNPNFSYANTYTDANTIVSGTTTWTGFGNYSAGLAKLNNKGATDTNAFAILTTTAPQAANATTFSTSSTSITGIYPYFWGVSSTLPTPSTIAAAIQAGTSNRVLAVGSGTLTITYNASSQYVWLAVQTGYAAKTTWYNTALNNGSIGAGQFILSPVSQAVTSPSGYWSGINYNVYISGYATTTSGSIQFS